MTLETRMRQIELDAEALRAQVFALEHALFAVVAALDDAAPGAEETVNRALMGCAARVRGTSATAEASAAAAEMLADRLLAVVGALRRTPPPAGS